VERHRPRLSPTARSAAWLALPLAFLLLFFAFPLTSILVEGLRADGRPDLGPLTDVVRDPHLRQVVWFTIWQAVVSTALTLLVGLPAAFVLSRFAFRGRALVEALVLVPFVLPRVVVGMAIGGARPSLANLFAAHVFFNVAVVVRVVGGYLSTLDPMLEDAAEGLGASWVRRITDVMLPLAIPAVTAAATLVFLFTFTSFGVVLLLGGPGRVTIEVEIFRRTSQLLDLSTAAALSVVQLAAVSALLLVDAAITSRSVTRRMPASRVARVPRTRGERVFVAAAVTGLLALVLLPAMRLVVRSLRRAGGLTLSHYTQLGSGRRGSLFAISPLGAVGASLRFAVAAALIALVIGIPAAVVVAGTRRSRGLWTLVTLPLGVSAVTIGFGYVVAFDADPLDLRGSVWLVPLAQAVVAIPFVVRIVAPALASIAEALSETAADLGASPARMARDVTLPLTSGAVLTAAVFAFVVSLGEFGATAFLARPDTPTMPVAIYRLLGQPGSASVGQAAAMATILMVVTACAGLAIARIRVGEFGRL
jgi:thiamine transport system permease protein